MALKKCKECDKEVSTKADKCPSCGYPLKSKGIGCLPSVIVIIVCTIFIGKCIVMQTEGPKKVAQTSQSQNVSTKNKPENQVQPKGFRNFKWGDQPIANLKKFSDSTDGITMYIPAAGKKPEPLYNLPVAEEAYYFSKAGFYSGDAWIDGKDNFNKMKAALIRTFGQPVFSNDQIHIYKWKWPKNQIEIHLNYQTKFSRTTVTFINKGI